MTEKKVTFAALQLSPPVCQAIADLHYLEPTKIQKAAIPQILAGQDLMAEAQTGTGKTLAFASALLTMLEPTTSLQVLVICPTRELAVQIKEEFDRLGKYVSFQTAAVYGGSDIRKQIQILRSGVEIVIGTPGRILDLMRKKVLRLKHLKCVVLDEADEMLHMGFIEDIECILKDTPTSKQTLLFSATLSSDVQKVAIEYLKKKAKRITVKEKSQTALTVEQFYFEIRSQERYEALCRILDGLYIQRAIIFCKTKRSVDALAAEMKQSGYQVEGMHGDLSQEMRLATLKRFKNGGFPYLIATDVAARGIDVQEVTHVINYELPQDLESYVHRIGRTGRANRKGQALSLVTRQEKGFLSAVERTFHTEIRPCELPTYKAMLQYQADQVLEEVTAVMQQGQHKLFLQHFQKLSHQDLQHVASALFYLQAHGHLGYQYDKEKIGYQLTTATVLLQLGSDYAVSTREVVKYLIEAGHLNQDDIGKIEMISQGIKVGLSNERALQLVKKRLPGTRLAGKKVKIKVIEEEKK